jgi:hypothetical protein
MKRSSFQLGQVTVNCFLTDSGEYLYSLTDVSMIVNKHHSSPAQFIESKGFKQGKGKDFTVRKCKMGNITYSLVPSWVVVAYLSHHARLGNTLAVDVLAQLAINSLDQLSLDSLQGDTRVVHGNPVSSSKLARVYVIGDVNEVGVTGNIAQRMATLENLSGRSLTLYWHSASVKRPKAFKLEGWLHGKLDHCRVNGEWFQVAFEDVIHLLSAIDKLAI